MNPVLLLIVCLFWMAMCSCSIHPFVSTSADGKQTASLGGSLMTKSVREGASITMRDGTVLTYSKDGLNETAVPISAIRTIGTAYAVGQMTKSAMSKDATDQAAIKDAGSTNRAGIGADVEKARIAADVEKLRITTP